VDKIASKWTKHLKTTKDKQDFKTRLFASKEITDVLKGLLQEDLNISNSEMRKESNYTLPSWAEFQADKLGEQRVLERLIKLLP